MYTNNQHLEVITVETILEDLKDHTALRGMIREAEREEVQIGPCSEVAVEASNA